MKRRLLLMILFACTAVDIPIFANVTADQFRSQNHPRVFATKEDRAALKEKIRDHKWAAQIYEDIKDQVDPLAEQHMRDPEFIVSRLQMHWDEGKHYVNFYTEGNFIPRREGNAKYPTVRLLYGRSAKDSVLPPSDLSRIPPYGNGDLPKYEDGRWVMVPFEKTQLGAEDVNKMLISHAYRAGILYYMTGDKKYAKFAADIIWTFVRGAAQHNEVNPQSDGGPYGYLSWETLGDSRRFATLPLAYDFIYEYLMNEYFDTDEFKNGRPGELWAPGHPQGKGWALKQFEVMFKKFIENKLTRGGGLEGNWNMNEQESAMLYALAMENDDYYEDGKGRQYYVNRLVYGPTSRYHGAYVDVAKANLSPETGLWPEPPGGYGQGSIQQLIRFGYVYFINGLDLIENEPLLRKGALSFPQMAFPNGFSTGWGDTNYLPVFTEQAELMIAYARVKGDIPIEQTFTNLLNFAGERSFEGVYYMPLFFFVPDLKPVTGTIEYPRVSYSPEHSIIFERNLGTTPRDALAYTVSGSGSRSGHRQQNGMTLELYGRGHVLGVDPGWGPDYWVAQHGRYNSQVASHNTVVPNGRSMAGQSAMDLEIRFAEPSVKAGVNPEVQLSPLCQFTDTAAVYKGDNLTANQRRLIGLVRTSEYGGYFVDIFRSAIRDGSDDDYHDYLYHNMGHSVSVFDMNGMPLVLTGKQLDPASGFGYEFFQDDRSASYSGDFYAVFEFGVDDTRMGMWMLGGQDRTIFSVTGPNNHRFYLNELKQRRVPTLLVRQAGQAWKRPFAAVYEPFGNGTKSSIKQIRRMPGVPIEGDFVGIAVEHHPRHGESAGPVEYILNATDADEKYGGEQIQFKGIYGIAAGDAGGFKYLYLGTGKMLVMGDHGLSSSPDRLMSAALGKKGPEIMIRAALAFNEPTKSGENGGDTGYSYSSDNEVTIRIPYPNPSGKRYEDLYVYYKSGDNFLPSIDTRAVCSKEAGKAARDGVLVARMPAATSARLYVRVKGTEAIEK